MADAEQEFLQGNISVDDLIKQMKAGGPAPAQATPQLGGAEEGFRALAVAPFENIAIRGQAAETQDPVGLQMLGSRFGTKFDIESGVSTMTRLKMSAFRNKEDQLNLLRQMPGVVNARLNKLEEPVVTVKNEKGEEIDILADPVGWEAGDFMTLLAYAPEMVMAVAASKAGINPRATGVVPWLRRIGQMAIGAEGTGVAKDMALQEFGTQDDLTGEETSQIMKERGVMFGVDLALGAALSGGVKAGSHVVSPFQKRAPIQIDHEAGMKFLNRNFGLSLESTPGTATGSQILLGMEAIEAQKPGSRGVFANMQNRIRGQLDRLKQIALGVSPDQVPSAEAVGQRGLAAAGAELAPLERAVSRETARLLQTATADIEHSIARATGIPTPVVETAVGAELFTGANTMWEAFQQDAARRYALVHGHPAIAGQGRNINATALARDAQDIISRIPSVNQQVPGPLLGPTGQPIPVTQTVPMTSFVESGTLARLRQLANAQNGQVSLRDLMELRRDIDDSLTRGATLGGIPERRLREIRDSITTRIRGGLNEVDQSGQALQLWENATDFYAQNIGRFKEVGIIEIFKDAEKRGSLGMHEIVDRALRDTDLFNAYRDFFGSGSREFALVRRAYADRVLGQMTGSDVVDANAFVSRLQQAFSGKQREIAEQVFGPQAANLRFFGEAAAQSLRKEVNKQELAHLIQRGTVTANALDDLVNAQEVRKEAYKNELFRKIVKGNEGPEVIRPTQFVDNLVFSRNTQPTDLSQLVAKLAGHPDVMEGIQMRTLLRIFNDSTSGPPGKEMMRASGLAQFLEGDQRERLRLVLGQDRLKMLDELRAYLAPFETAQQSFKSSGTFQATTQINQLERGLTGRPGTAFEALSNIGRSFFMASVYLFPPVRNWLKNHTVGTGGSAIDTATWMNFLIASTPVTKHMLEIYGDENARLLQIHFKENIDEIIKNAQSSADPILGKYLQEMGIDGSKTIQPEPTQP